MVTTPGTQVALVGIAVTCPSPLQATARWLALTTAVDKGLRILDLTSARELAVVRTQAVGGESTEWRGSLEQTIGLGRVTPGAAVLQLKLACTQTAVVGEKRTYSYGAKALSAYEQELADHRALMTEFVAAADKAIAAWDKEYQQAVARRDGQRNAWNRFWVWVAEAAKLPIEDGGYAAAAKELRGGRYAAERAAQALASPKQLADAAAKRVDRPSEAKPSVHAEAHLTDGKDGHILALVVVERVADDMEGAMRKAMQDVYSTLMPVAKKGGR